MIDEQTQRTNTMTNSDKAVLNTSSLNSSVKSNKPSIHRLTLSLTAYEIECLEALILHHYDTTGVLLSKNAYIRSIIIPSLREAQEYLMPVEKFQ